MYRRDDSGQRRGFLSNDGHRLFDSVRLCRVVAGHGRRWVINGTPLLASTPGCAGDRGTVAGEAVLGVLEESFGPLHIFEQPPHLRIGQHVLVARDEVHRSELERTNAAVVILVRELEANGAEVLETEVVAGQAWVDFSGKVADIDLRPAISVNESLETISSETGIRVWTGGRAIETFRAPIARKTGEIGRVVVERVVTGPSCNGTMRLRLTD